MKVQTISLISVVSVLLEYDCIQHSRPVQLSDVASYQQSRLCLAALSINQSIKQAVFSWPK